MEFKDAVEVVGKALDIAGVAVIVGGIFLATVVSARRLAPRAGRDEYRQYRQGVGRAILLGLEILVAADIIRTVAVNPTFRSAGVLGIIVVIRTFLSFSLEVELEGRWPWQGTRPGTGDRTAGDDGDTPERGHHRPIEVPRPSAPRTEA